MNDKFDEMRNELVHDRDAIKRVRDILNASQIETDEEHLKVNAYLAGYLDCIDDVLNLVDKTALK